MQYRATILQSSLGTCSFGLGVVGTILEPEGTQFTLPAINLEPDVRVVMIWINLLLKDRVPKVRFDLKRVGGYIILKGAGYLVSVSKPGEATHFFSVSMWVRTHQTYDDHLPGVPNRSHRSPL